MIFDFKGHKVSNSLSVFNYYKQAAGTSLESDILSLRKFQSVVENPETTDEELEKALEECEVDHTTILQFVYYAMRCAAEKKELDFKEVIDELDTTDLIDGSVEELIKKLVEVKKKEVGMNRLRVFLAKKK
jgi:hypothetical protein